MNIDNCDFLDDNFDELFLLMDKINDKILKETKRDANVCVECNTNEYVVEDLAQGINVCTKCGLVADNIHDAGQEWRQYKGDDAKEGFNRCGQATNFFLPQSSIGTSIACSNFSKIKVLHSWGSMPYKERSLSIVLKIIESKCQEGKIVKCIEDEAKIMYKNISDPVLRSTLLNTTDNKMKSTIVRGSNRRSLIAACVFFACKKKGVTRSPKEIAKLFGLKYKHVTKGCKTFQKLVKERQLIYDINVSTPDHFINRFGRELHLSNEYIDQALQIAKNTSKLNIISVHTPLSVAIGSLVLIIELNNLNISNKDISDKFGISEVTFRKTTKKMEKYKDLLLNDEATETMIKTIQDEKKKTQMNDTLQSLFDRLNTHAFDDYSEEEYDDDKSLSHVKDNSNNLREKSLKDWTENHKMQQGYDIDLYIDEINMEVYEVIENTNKIYEKFLNIRHLHP